MLVKLSSSFHSIPFIHAALTPNSMLFSLTHLPISTPGQNQSFQNLSKPFLPCCCLSASAEVGHLFSHFLHQNSTMSEFSLSSTAANKKTDDFSTLFLSDFMLFCSFILSHPLYFSYFIFFSPYLFKLFSFLSPLFVTTSLLLLALFTLTPTLFNDASPLEFPDSKVSLLLTAYQTLVENLKSCKVDGDINDLGCFEELEVFKIVFDTSTLEIQAKEACVQVIEARACSGDAPEGLKTIPDGNSVQILRPEAEANEVSVEIKCLEDLLQEKEEFETLSGGKEEKEEKEVKPLSAESDKGGEEKEEEKMGVGSGSEATKSKTSEVNKVKPFKGTVNSQRLGANFSSTESDEESNYKNVDNHHQALGSNLGSFGSMRREKEWRRTLACKLFEERHNAVDGGEGMDSLWETYETDSNKMQLKTCSKKGKKGSSTQYYDAEDDEDDDDDYDDEADGQLCCLQALKFSAGKMNLGMGRPNLVKISKAFKGIGWLHHVGSRHSKKGYR